MGLFKTIELEPEAESQAGRPLADRMRPRTLDEFIGQEELLAPGKPLRTQIERDDLSSMLLWGPPGCAWRARLFLWTRCIASTARNRTLFFRMWRLGTFC